jgi:hypothetical protein
MPSLKLKWNIENLGNTERDMRRIRNLKLLAVDLFQFLVQHRLWITVLLDAMLANQLSKALLHTGFKCYKPDFKSIMSRIQTRKATPSNKSFI